MDLDIIAKIVTYIFVFIIYAFILNIIRMVRLDIKIMSRKKSTNTKAPAYLKLINLRQNLDFPIQESYPLYEDNTLGRSRKCSIPIADPFLSQMHCHIFQSDESFYLEDCGSTNGTFLNGERLDKNVIELLDGDKVTLGKLHFIFVIPQNMVEQGDGS